MKNRTRRPRAQAANANAQARWVFPVPLLPTSRTFSRAAMYSPRISSRISASLTDGWAAKSKVSSVLSTGKPAALIRRSAARCSRSMTSRSTSRSR